MIITLWALDNQMCWDPAGVILPDESAPFVWRQQMGGTACSQQDTRGHFLPCLDLADVLIGHYRSDWCDGPVAEAWADAIDAVLEEHAGGRMPLLVHRGFVGVHGEGRIPVLVQPNGMRAWRELVGRTGFYVHANSD